MATRNKKRERQVITASEAQEGRRGIILFGAALSAPIVLAGLLLYIWTHLGVIRLGYRISEEKKVQARILETNRMLQLERAKFSSLHRIEALGKGEIGLVEPTPGQMVIIP